MFTLFILLTSVPALVNSETTDVPRVNNFCGLWVATVYNIDYPVKPTTDAEILKSEALTVLDTAQNSGFNAIFLQVRPASDALYPSKYYPWSKYLTGTQGLAPSDIAEA
jgi:uncharacterized lipoprotein YddW (UPF0748 family)